ncbi:MAG: HpcH/HpaI aldolase/citrate lyase family protein [Rhodospirillaceae bacterium]|nr:HpcH/HpaI aldolase/citrate lyase family protein [Rhodospirillaceae bacterium]
MSDLLANTFKAGLAGYQTLFGFWQALGCATTAEISATAGFDWLLFDGEHGPNDIPLLLSQLQAVSAYQVHAVARPPANDARLIKQYLDIGFQTLLVPFIETPEQAAILVTATRYPPAGVRGLASGIVRASRWNAIPHYIRRADAEICVLAQIESRTGLDNITAIARVSGIDGIFIGPSDLSAALGYPGEPSHPDVLKAIESAIAAVRAAGKPVGILAADPALARRYVGLGCRFVAVGTDAGLFASGVRRLANEIKSAPVATQQSAAAY